MPELNTTEIHICWKNKKRKGPGNGVRETLPYNQALYQKIGAHYYTIKYRKSRLRGGVGILTEPMLPLQASAYMYM